MYIKLDASKVHSKLNKISGGLKELRPFFNEMSEYFEKTKEQQFGSQGSKLNTRWPALKRSTIEQRVRSGYGAAPILVRSGKMRSSFRVLERTRTRLRYGTKSTYYRYHQLGTRKMPQRQVLGWSAKMVFDTNSIFKSYLQKTIRG